MIWCKDLYLNTPILVCHISFVQIKKIGLTHPIKPSLNTLYTIIKSANIKHKETANKETARDAVGVKN